MIKFASYFIGKGHLTEERRGGRWNISLALRFFAISSIDQFYFAILM